MKLKIETDVSGNYKHILDQFNSDLFLALSPSFPALKIIRFDGSFPEDKVEVELKAFGLTYKWSSEITERNTTDTEAWFTDEGLILPPPLKYWKHRHLVTRMSENKSRITDLIFYSTGNYMLDAVLYPLLWATFVRRKPVYRRWFRQN